jgi:hypothetical protein
VDPSIVISRSEAAEQVSLTVLLLSTGERYEVQVALDIIANVFKEHCIKTLGISKSVESRMGTESGRVINQDLFFLKGITTRTTLTDDLTLRENGVCNGDQLLIQMRVTAG